MLILNTILLIFLLDKLYVVQTVGLSKLSQIDKWDSSILPYTSDSQSYVYWNCHTIPPNMTLCKSIGYSRMVLPNFLQHESLREAIQQANVWVALVNTDCHPDIQRFLCSLYAPVCLKSHQEAKIPPCWELCDEVRNACLPRMRLFGFDWPEIVRCKQFPRLAESMCIPPQEKTTAVTCVPCEQAITLENIASSYCMSDVVLKASIKDLIPRPNDASIILQISPRTIAFKLIRNDGTQLSSIDQYRRKRRSQKRHNNVLARRYRNVKDHYRSEEGIEDPMRIDRGNALKSLKRKNVRRRLKPRNSRLHDLDGINELVLGCSACRALLPFTQGHLASSLISQKWLVMGRRIKDEKTNKYNNQLQVTFLGIWNRESAEFRQSLYAIRKEPVAHLCNRNQTTLAAPARSRTNDYNVMRPLKIMRSAPSELSDSPLQPDKFQHIQTSQQTDHLTERERNNQYSEANTYNNDNNNAVDRFATPSTSQQLIQPYTPHKTMWVTHSRLSNNNNNFETFNSSTNKPNQSLNKSKAERRKQRRERRRQLKKQAEIDQQQQHQRQQQQLNRLEHNGIYSDSSPVPINPYAFIH